MMPPADGDEVMVGSSSAMQHLREIIALTAGCDLPVLITGETGSGKELVARALHRGSGRRGNFVPVNACAPSEGIFEDAMFGHVRGAFTGAMTDRSGYFAEADGGTLFLDEISGLSRVTQAKLLRAVETKRFRPVGARQDRASDFRLVSASNESLDALVSRGDYRSDLAHRLRGIEIEVPPLRTRMDDIKPLVEHFLVRSRRTGDSMVRFAESALDLLYRHAWPGNVRELRHLVERTVALSPGRVLVDADALERAWNRAGSRKAAAPARSGESRRILIESLLRHQWQTSRVAEELGVTRKTVYAWMRKFGIPIHRIYRRRGEFTLRSGESGESPEAIAR